MKLEDQSVCLANLIANVNNHPDACDSRLLSHLSLLHLLHSLQALAHETGPAGEEVVLMTQPVCTACSKVHSGHEHCAHSWFASQSYPWCPDAAAICATVAAQYQHPIDELPAGL